MPDLVQWLRAQLDEDERIARKSIEMAAVLLAAADAAPISRWRVSERPATGVFVTARDQWDRETEVVPTYGGAYSEHIAEWDPARVLREIDAGREMLSRYEAMAAGVLVMIGMESILSEYRRVVLPNLALRYADRPGYREEWRP